MKYSEIPEINEALIRLNEARSRDAYDDRLGELALVAKDNLDDISKVYFERKYDSFPIVWIMDGIRHNTAFEILKDAINNESQYVRWAAARGMKKFRNKEADKILINCLKDRSHFVKGTAVEAMKRIKDKRAIPFLEHILSLPSLNKNAPGIIENAKEALEILQVC